MERKINKVKLFVNQDNKSEDVHRKLMEQLLLYHFEIVEEDYDLAISIGGDGSFLRMVRENNFNEDIYYIGINSGTLGFLQEININETTDFIERLNNNEFKEEKICYLTAKIFTKYDTYSYNCLNEIVIREKSFSVLNADVYVDNELLEHFTGDGILVSTSTGSTAYNMSFGGSIIYNTLDAFILTPVAPINNRNCNTLTNSIIIPNDKKVVLQNKNHDLFLMVDGINKEVNDDTRIEIGIANRQIKCLRMNNFDFIQIVNKKIIEK